MEEQENKPRSIDRSMVVLVVVDIVDRLEAYAYAYSRLTDIPVGKRGMISPCALARFLLNFSIVWSGL